MLLARLAASGQQHVNAIGGWDVKIPMMKERVTLSITAAGAVGLVLLQSLAWQDVGSTLELSGCSSLPGCRDA
jgi:hypothetical protein